MKAVEAHAGLPAPLQARSASVDAPANQGGALTAPTRGGTALSARGHAGAGRGTDRTTGGGAAHGQAAGLADVLASAARPFRGGAGPRAGPRSGRAREAAAAPAARAGGQLRRVHPRAAHPGGGRRRDRQRPVLRDHCTRRARPWRKMAWLECGAEPSRHVVVRRRAPRRRWCRSPRTISRSPRSIFRRPRRWSSRCTTSPSRCAGAASRRPWGANGTNAARAWRRCGRAARMRQQKELVQSAAPDETVAKR